ncbi:hypothetical protein ASPSYDRAFT_620980 [Aspergillus sydowii CBS 593.65]|uniref:Uncharacterized protein n=1 Tax=Aspergillus sydowii CBS 593.65 TaxID=1036612 RepID=A0A1L9TRY3_9EURO|nr:uncharacterized protein ASPSYDRAFT_620980 [Aspergillus sydowii CBS 593.65]OJJ62192.1 hypothetical protein ASPSYDRAFT_620980 [Aspergillus sydowii CBS 593.65]
MREGKKAHGKKCLDWKIHRSRTARLCLIVPTEQGTVRLDKPQQLDQSIRNVASGRKEATDQTFSIIIPRARDRAQRKGRGLACDVTLVVVVNLQVVWVSWRPGRSVSKFQLFARLRSRSGRTLSPSIAERGTTWSGSSRRTRMSAPALHTLRSPLDLSTPTLHYEQIECSSRPVAQYRQQLANKHSLLRSLRYAAIPL